jgi:hypothetical protein
MRNVAHNGNTKLFLPPNLAASGVASDDRASSGYSSPTLNGSLSHLFPPAPHSIPGLRVHFEDEHQLPEEKVHASLSRVPSCGSRMTPSPTPTPSWHFRIGTWNSRGSSRSSSGIGHDYESMLLQTESLAALSNLELLARHCRIKNDQRVLKSAFGNGLALLTSNLSFVMIYKIFANT